MNIHIENCYYMREQLCKLQGVLTNIIDLWEQDYDIANKFDNGERKMSKDEFLKMKEKLRDWVEYRKYDMSTEILMKNMLSGLYNSESILDDCLSENDMRMMLKRSLDEAIDVYLNENKGE